jgi:hypothetical protein
MEIFVDFGLFELLVAMGLARVAGRLYASRLAAGILLLASVTIPAALVVLGSSELTRWLAAGALATALVNAAFIVTVLRRPAVEPLP